MLRTVKPDVLGKNLLIAAITFFLIMFNITPSSAGGWSGKPGIISFSKSGEEKTITHIKLIIQQHKEEALAGVSNIDLGKCQADENHPICEIVWKQIIQNLTRIISLSYKPTNSMSLFDPGKVEYSSKNTQLLILAAQ